MSNRVGILFAAVTIAALAAPQPSHAAESRAYLLTSDFSTGSMSAMDLSSRAVSTDCLLYTSDAADE